MIAWAAAQAGSAPLWPGIPADVEVDARARDGRTAYVAINWSTGPRTLSPPSPMTDLIGGAGQISALTLAPYGVAVLTPP